jgi:hypothetical protein
MKPRARFFRAVLGPLFTAALLSAPGALAQTPSWQIAGAGDFQTGTNGNFGMPTSAINAFVTNGTSGTESIVNLASGGVTHDVPEPGAWIDLAFMVAMVLGSRLLSRRFQAK